MDPCSYVHYATARAATTTKVRARVRIWAWVIGFGLCQIVSDCTRVCQLVSDCVSSRPVVSRAGVPDEMLEGGCIPAVLVLP